MAQINSSAKASSLMHHLTLDKAQKKTHLFQILEKLKNQTGKMSRIIVLTESNLTADYLSCCLNLKGTETKSIHNFKSEMENSKSTISFNGGSLAVLITNKLDIKLTLSRVQHIINYDMFTPNILYFERNHSDDVFHNM